MALLRSVWKIAVGVKDFLVLMLLLLLFAGLWAAFNATAPVARVPDGGALLLDLDGVLVDQPTEPDPLTFLSATAPIAEIAVPDLVRAIDRAADDKRISAIVLDLDRFLGGGQANLHTVGAALTRFRAAGKPVESWATAYIDDGYYLAAHADRIWLSPMGMALVAGPGGSQLYFKQALDKLRVTVEVFRVGTYKSFVEPFTRTDSSPEARTASQELADDLWTSWRADVQRQRPQLDMAALLASWPARSSGSNRSQAELALDAELVDHIGTPTAFGDAVAETAGRDKSDDRPGSFRAIDYRSYLAGQPEKTGGPAVGIVHVTGEIVDGEAPAGAAAGGDSVAALIADAIADDDVKAIVLRVDSPGGSAIASEVIRAALMDARARNKPVVASMGPVAASGGYWVAMGAEMIFAHPATITGSIGVFGILPTFERTLNEIGITSDGVGTTPFSGQPDLIGGLNAPVRAVIQGSVEDIYRQFLALVAEARQLPAAEVATIAEGRVWSGRRALELKLIDAFGGLDAAIAEAGKRGGIEGKPRVKMIRREPGLLAQLLGSIAGPGFSPGIARQGLAPSLSTADALSRQTLASRSRALAQVQSAIAVANGPTVQVHCLTCVAHTPVRAVVTTSDLATSLARR